jgi:anti-sigma B factor antagonist
VTTFRHELDRDGAAVVVRPVGEMDYRAAEAFQRALLELLEEDGGRDLVIDLRGLTFMDSTGLRAVLTAVARGSSLGSGVRLVRGGDRVHRVFEMTKLVDRMQWVEPD